MCVPRIAKALYAFAVRNESDFLYRPKAPCIISQHFVGALCDFMLISALPSRFGQLKAPATLFTILSHLAPCFFFSCFEFSCSLPFSRVVGFALIVASAPLHWIPAASGMRTTPCAKAVKSGDARIHTALSHCSALRSKFLGLKTSPSQAGHC